MTSGCWWFTIFTVHTATHRFKMPSASRAVPSRMVSSRALSQGRNTRASPMRPAATASARVSHQVGMPKR